MSDSIINISPKNRFMANNSVVKAHRSMASSEEFQFALDMALLEYQGMLANQKADMQVGAASHFKLCGAHDLALLLKTLAEPSRVPTPAPDRDNLKH